MININGYFLNKNIYLDTNNFLQIFIFCAYIRISKFFRSTLKNLFKIRFNNVFEFLIYFKKIILWKMLKNSNRNSKYLNGGLKKKLFYTKPFEIKI